MHKKSCSGNCSKKRCDCATINPNKALDFTEFRRVLEKWHCSDREEALENMDIARIGVAC